MYATTLEAALAYAKSGIYVFPVYVTRKPDGKKDIRFPTLWRTTSTTGAADIAACWGPGETHENAGIGIDCGKSGLVILDADGPEGLANLEALGLPATTAVKTFRGQHLYYRQHPRHIISNDQDGTVAASVDVRGLGGCVVTAPTPGYEWLTAPDWADLPTVPDIIVQKMAGKRAPSSAPAPTADGPAPEAEFFDEPARLFTEAEAVAFVKEAGLRLKATRSGYNGAINAFAMACAHFPQWFDRDRCARLVIKALGPTTGWTAPDHQDLATIDSAYTATEAGRSWTATVRTDDPAAAEQTIEPIRRQVDLTPYLDGTYKPPTPSVGEYRDCGRQLLYPGKWHTVVALNASGKSWFALWHVVAELRAGRTVVYAHFEESMPGGTLDRLQLMAPELQMADLIERFKWLDCSSPWRAGEFAAALPAEPSLVVLDGINAAASQHGYDASDIRAPGAYRGLFVTPAVTRGAAVLSLGHPPKAKDRQGERHGFGSTAWLDEVDGVGFRLEAAKKRPIRRGEDGYSMLYVVKDRYGQVESIGVLDDERDAGWYKLGAFHVDGTEARIIRARLGVIDTTPDGVQKDRVDHLADAVVALLGTEKAGGQFASWRALVDSLKAERVKFTASDLSPALERLADQGAIVWPEAAGNKSRPGWLAQGASAETVDDLDLEEF
jgi:hypothetical protein